MQSPDCTPTRTDELSERVDESPAQTQPRSQEPSHKQPSTRSQLQAVVCFIPIPSMARYPDSDLQVTYHLLRVSHIEVCVARCEEILADHSGLARRLQDVTGLALDQTVVVAEVDEVTDEVRLGAFGDERAVETVSLQQHYRDICARGRLVVRLIDDGRDYDSVVARETAWCQELGIATIKSPAMSPLDLFAWLTGAQAPYDDGISVWRDRLTGSISTRSLPTTDNLVLVSTMARLPQLANAVKRAKRDPLQPVLAVVNLGPSRQYSVLTTVKNLRVQLATEPLSAADTLHLGIGDWVRSATATTVDTAPEANATAAPQPTHWFETNPLHGWRCLIPYTVSEPTELLTQLAVSGMHAEGLATLTLAPARNLATVTTATHRLIDGHYRWLVLSSLAVTKTLADTFAGYGYDLRALSGINIAATGDDTCAYLRAAGIITDLAPPDDRSLIGLARNFPAYDDYVDPINKICVPQGEISTQRFCEAVERLGWVPDSPVVNRVTRAHPPGEQMRSDVKAGRYDVIIVESATSVRNLVALVGKPHRRTRLVAGGIETAKACQELGLTPAVVVTERSPRAIVSQLYRYALQRQHQLVSAGRFPDRPSVSRATRRRNGIYRAVMGNLEIS